MRSSYYFLLCLGVTTLIACSKTDVPTPQGQRLHKLVFTNSMDSTYHVTLGYDAQERLVALTDSNSQSHMGFRSLHYNAQGKLIKTIFRRYYGTWNNLLHQGADSMILDANGNIVKHVFLHDTNTSQGSFVFNSYGYDIQGRLVADTSHSNLNNSINSIYRYTYDVNGNVIQTEYIYDPLGSPVTTVSSISYTTQLNPLHNLGIAGYLFFSSADILSKHLPLAWSSNGENAHYTYQYNSNGTLAKIVTAYSGVFGTDSTTTELIYQ